jgi:hypothetical protein
MAISLVQFKTGTSASATVSWSFDSATTTGNLIVGVISSDDYTGTPDSGWTESSEMGLLGYHGAYLWWRVSTGETSPQSYSLNGAANSAWMLMEFSGVDATPYDASEGVNVDTNGVTYATPTITPTAGDRLLLARLGASDTASMAGQTVSWSDSFTNIGAVGSANGGVDDFVACGYRLVTANGSDGYSTTGTYSDAGNESRSALIISFKAAAAGGSIVPQAMAQYINQVIS